MFDKLVRKLNNLGEKLLVEYFHKRFTFVKPALERRQEKFIHSLEQLHHEIEAYDIISFDIFDTALYRKVQSYQVARQIKEIELARFLNKGDNSLAGIWLKALHACSEKFEAFTQDRLYQCIIQKGNLQNITPGDIQKIDMGVEKKLLYANPVIKKLYDHALQLGKRIIFISDMYLDNSCLAQLLENCGYKNISLYVSSVNGKSKHKGDIFPYVLAKEEIAPGRVLHIGDNYNSDVVHAQKAGFHAFHFDKKKIISSLFDLEKHGSPPSATTINEKIFTGLARHYTISRQCPEKFNKTLHPLGYEVIGPVHLMYLFWLIRRSKEKGITKLFFLSRDGYYLKQWFDKINERFSTGIEGVYTFASRRLYTLPVISELNEVNLETLTKADQEITVKDLLKRLGINSDEVKDELYAFGFDRPSEVLTDFKGYYMKNEKRENLKQFFVSIKDKVLAKTAKERELLLKYYCNIGLDSNSSALVDVGWNASSLHYINRLLESENKALPTGFYFGTWYKASHIYQHGFDLESFFVHLGQPRLRREILIGNIAALELFFTAPHPSIIGLKYDNGWEAIYESYNYSATEKQIVASLFAGAGQFVEDALQIPGLQLDSAYSYIQVVLKKLVVNPEYTWAKELGKFGHKISFGAIDKIMLIAPEPWPNPSAKEKVELLHHSLWQNGTKAMLKKK